MSDQKTTQLHNAETDNDIKQLSVIQDVETRWNSALAMARRILQIFPAIYQVLLANKATHLLLTANETTKLQDIVTLLEPFETATIMVSSASNQTVGLILPTMAQFKLVYLAAKDTDSDMIKRAKAAMLADFNKRYTKDSEQRLLFLGSLTDPRFKTLRWADDEQKQDALNALKEEALAIALGKIKPANISIKQEPKDNDNCRLQQPQDVPAFPELPSLPDEDHEKDPPVQSAMQAFFGDVTFVKEEKKEVSPVQVVEKEIDWYLSEPTPYINQNPVEWWRERAGQFPVLSQVALRYLMIPVTSVPSERALQET